MLWFQKMKFKCLTAIKFTAIFLLISALISDAILQTIAGPPSTFVLNDFGGHGTGGPLQEQNASKPCAGRAGFFIGAGVTTHLCVN
jgi:hypothetical protein